MPNSERFDYYDTNDDGVVGRDEFNDGVATGCSCMVKSSTVGAFCMLCQGRKPRPQTVVAQLAVESIDMIAWREASVGGPAPNGLYHKGHRRAGADEPLVGGYHRGHMHKGAPEGQIEPTKRTRKSEQKKDTRTVSQFASAARAVAKTRGSFGGLVNKRYTCNPARAARPELGERAGTVPTGMRRGRPDPGLQTHSEYGVEYIKRKSSPQKPCGTRFNDLDPVRWLGIGPQGMSGVHGNVATALDRSRTMRYYEEPSSKWAPQKKLHPTAAGRVWREAVYATPHYKCV